MTARSETTLDRRRRPVPASAWTISLAIHAVIVAVLAMVTWVAVRSPEPDRLLTLSAGQADEGAAGGGDAEADSAVDTSEGELSEQAAAARALQTPPAPTPTAMEASLTALTAAPAPPSGTGDMASGVMRSLTDLGGAGGSGVQGAGLTGLGAGLGKEIDGMRRRGLDVVLIMDVTSSMRSAIEQARKRLSQVIDVVAFLVPRARFGMVAYKDYGDEYGAGAIRTLKITNDQQAVRTFLNGLTATGGGDRPEPIDEALAAAVHPTKLGWRRGATRVIILIADAPVHPSGRSRALQAARGFRKQFRGRINTIDVSKSGQAGVMADLQDIASYGGGAAFGLDADREFWRHLIISVFGKKYAADVNTIIDRIVKE